MNQYDELPEYVPVIDIVNDCRNYPISVDLIHACERGEDDEFLQWALDVCKQSIGEEWEVASIILTAHKLFELYQEMRDGAQ